VKRSTLNGVLIVTAIMAALLLNSRPVYSVDELHLVGIVKNINPKTGIVFVDVKSSSCLGMRKFKMDDTSEKDDLIGKKIEFTIDSSVCDDDVHRMILPGE